MKIKHLYLSSLTSLAVLAAGAAYAEQDVYVPTLEGGITASLGTFLYATSSDDTGFPDGIADDNAPNNNGGYNWGWQASLEYVFDETANSVELFYRGLASSDTENYNVGLMGEPTDVNDKLKYNLETGDLMITQFVNLGQSMQMRLLGGLSYLFLERKESISGQNTSLTGEFSKKSKFSGFGPRLGLDGRYDFGQGVGVVGGASLAYFLGTAKFTDSVTASDSSLNASNSEQNDNHNVTNLRANLGIDYVFYMDEDDHDYPTFGIELGYQVDYYADAITVAQTHSITPAPETFQSASTTFSGPYLNIKGAF